MYNLFQNTLIKDANLKVIGKYLVPLEKITFASAENAIREIDIKHVNRLISTLSSSYMNGDAVNIHWCVMGQM